MKGLFNSSIFIASSVRVLGNRHKKIEDEENFRRPREIVHVQQRFSEGGVGGGAENAA